MVTGNYLRQLEVIYAPCTRNKLIAPLAVPPRSGKSQHARGRRLCPNPHPRKHRCGRPHHPRLRKPVHAVRASASWISPADAQVGLSLTVDQNGRPQNIQVIKSLTPFWDARVIDAVSKFHFRAGTIDQATHSGRPQPHRQYRPLNPSQPVGMLLLKAHGSEPYQARSQESCIFSSASPRHSGIRPSPFVASPRPASCPPRSTPRAPAAPADSSVSSATAAPAASA